MVSFGVLLCCRKSANTKASMLYWVCGDRGLDSVFSSKDWLMGSSISIWRLSSIRRSLYLDH
jgi:hypothetical protein